MGYYIFNNPVFHVSCLLLTELSSAFNQHLKTVALLPLVYRFLSPLVSVAPAAMMQVSPFPPSA